MTEGYVRARVAVVGLIAILACCSPALALTDAERAEICREAAERYRALYGRELNDEGFIVIMTFKDNFCPQSITLPQGSRLRWINVDRRTSHSVWFKQNGKPESERIFPEETIDMTVDWPPGEYPYLCGPHWEKEGMVGRLTVTGRN